VGSRSARVSRGPQREERVVQYGRRPSRHETRRQVVEEFSVPGRHRLARSSELEIVEVGIRREERRQSPGSVSGEFDNFDRRAVLVESRDDVREASARSRNPKSNRFGDGVEFRRVGRKRRRVWSGARKERTLLGAAVDQPRQDDSLAIRQGGMNPTSKFIRGASKIRSQQLFEQRAPKKRRDTHIEGK